MEKIWGPISGFYIAAYSLPCASGRGFLSYAKVCAEAPDNYWDARPIFKLFGGDDHETEVAALACARLAAQTQIERIPTRQSHLLGFASFDQARQVVFPLSASIRRRAA